MIEDAEERPGDGNAAGKITFGRGEGVGGRSGLQEEQGQEDEDLGENAGRVVQCIDAEGIKCSDEDEEGGETVPEGEGKMDPEFVIDILGGMMLLDDVVDVRDSGAD